MSKLKCTETSNGGTPQDESTRHTNLFEGTRFYFIEKGIGKVRLQVLKQQVANKGGIVEKSFSKDTAIVITALDFHSCLAHMGLTPKEYELLALKGKSFHTPEYISEALIRGKKPAPNEFRIFIPPVSPPTRSTSMPLVRASSQVFSQTSPEKYQTENLRSESFIGDSKKFDLGINPSKRRKLSDEQTSPSLVRKPGGNWLQYEYDETWEGAADEMQPSEISILKQDEESPTGKHSQPVTDLSSFVTFHRSTSNIMFSQTLEEVLPDDPIEDDEDVNPYMKVAAEEKAHCNEGGSSLESDDRNGGDESSSEDVYTDPGGNTKKTRTDFRRMSSASEAEKRKLERRRSGFACQSSPEKLYNLNSHITDVLEVLEEAARNSGDKWRSFAYRKAISVLKNRPEKIESVEQARKLRGIGERIADKIAEILETGKLRKAELQAKDEMTQVFALFSNVFGAGPSTIQKWYAQGFRTLEDLATKAQLNEQQRIGVKYYYDLQQRIPRERVEQITSVIKEQLLSLGPDFTMEVCGSYRRGKADCGDIDVLITHPKEKKLQGLLLKLIPLLRSANIITDDLVSISNDQDKYMGICWFRGGCHHRIDIQVVPSHEWPFALLYFTGSDHFNRSMRLWARRHGFSLSEHSLVRRYTEDVKGDPITGIKTEKDIFDALGLEYKAPHERDV